VLAPGIARLSSSTASDYCQRSHASAARGAPRSELSPQIPPLQCRPARAPSRAGIGGGARAGRGGALLGHAARRRRCCCSAPRRLTRRGPRARARTLATNSERVLGALWGKLAAEILMQNWDAALDDLTRLKDIIDANTFAPLLQQLQQRTWLMHWALFVFFNHDNGRNAIIDLFFQDRRAAPYPYPKLLGDAGRCGALRHSAGTRAGACPGTGLAPPLRGAPGRVGRRGAVHGPARRAPV
jgi:hypothetical protein